MNRKIITILLATLLLLSIAGVSFAADKHFEGIRVVFFPGGSPGGEHRGHVRRGARTRLLRVSVGRLQRVPGLCPCGRSGDGICCCRPSSFYTAPPEKHV